jgi:hypothetical protein
MMTVEDRLATVVSLLPEHEQRRFAAPFAKGESDDSRLVEAVQALAKTEGLSCSTQAEMAQARARVLAQVARQPATPTPAGEDEAATLKARFAAHTTPHTQTAFWRSLTPWERSVLTRTEPAQ